MGETKSSLKISIDLSQLCSYEGEAPAAVEVSSGKVKSASSRSNRPRQRAVTERAGRSRKAADVAVARDRLATGDAPIVSARGRTKTESLIVLFHARKRSLFSDSEKGFEYPERPIDEMALSPIRRQPKEADISTNLASIKLAGSSRPNEKNKRSHRDVKLPETAIHRKKNSREFSSIRDRVTAKVKSTGRTKLEAKQRPSDIPRNSYEKLLHYLTLVCDYPEEFEKIRRLTANVSTSPAAVRSLVRIGRPFTTGHRHFGRRETPVQTAAYELGCRQKYSAWVAATPKEAPTLSPRQSANSTEATSQVDLECAEVDLSEHARRPDMEQMLTQHGVRAAELWLARRDAQNALATVSTHQSLREREKALHALGEAEGSQQQWWVSQKHCRYLRT
ncbi:hypothetical protein LSAT2_021726 [Lamellibrachia satsuma]|nr:hypothetical protein LSAT2_021726 [Lamellibrachia satsuma]